MSRRLRLGLVAAVLAVGAVQVAVAFSRSLIPHRIDGRLEAVGVVHDTDQRLFTATIGGRTYVVDNRQVVDLRIGRHLAKDAWSTTLWADGRKPVRLPVGDEAFQFAALTVLAAAATWFLTAPGVDAGPARVGGSGRREPDGGWGSPAPGEGSPASGQGSDRQRVQSSSR